ncbi:DUF6414 family protein [Bacillus sp. FF-1]|nr:MULTISPECIES: DUF6414 family protein [Bacillus]MDC7738937.1 DUF6414 family protein [Bacillus sp. FF-1]
MLESAKGYYKLVVVDGFRNNYRLQDLQLITLTLYGVKVGEGTNGTYI